MDDNIFDKVHDVDTKKKMETAYIDYAMSVIAARALPRCKRWFKTGTAQNYVCHGRIK